MEWNVYYYNVNHRKIETYNLFGHGSFQKELRKIISEYTTKEEFAEKLKSNLMYYFWSRAEWEIILAPWVGGDREKDAEKIDVYDQIMMNWDIFLNYVWNNMLKLIKDEKDES